MTLAPGFRLGPYEILAPLGAGGMGEVYRARDPRLGRDVAIKVLPASLSEDADRRRRFEKEARSASALNHPNIVTVYEIGSSDATSYIAMELVAGVTLRQVLSDGALPLKKLLRIGTQIAEGLARAHEAGIVHRDLKPENVMVTPDGHLKILDFGLAKLTLPEGQGGGTHAPTVSGGTEPGIVMGTVAYMSPEQALGKPFDFRSDQFALGSVLYEMATGKRAFSRASGPETMAAVIREEPEPIGTIAPKTPAPLRWIVERCLGKDPHERYGSTSDLARDLATLRDHLAEATSSGEMVSLAAPRPRLRKGWVLAVLGILVAASAAYWIGTKGTENVAPSYRRLTFRNGTVYTARFAHDGQTIVYSAAWEGQPARIFATRAGSIESRSLQLPDARVLSVSATGELAIAMGRETIWESAGTLARVPLEGGAPRELLENVTLADWTPDGRDLAVVHEVGGKQRLEFPMGKVLYETTEVIGSVRFSPRGDRLAVSPGGSIILVDLSGKATTLLKEWVGMGNVAWRPDGNEIWFGGHKGSEKFAVHAVTPSGRERTVRQEAGGLYLHDVSKDGRVLLNDYFWHSSLAALPAGESAERDLSWMDQPIVDAISNDGRTVVFDEWGEGGGNDGSVYLRATGGSAAVRLGEGAGLALSSDGRWVLAHPSLSPSPDHLELLPTGPGQPRRLDHKGITSLPSGRLMPDGKRFLFLGRSGTGSLRIYVQNLDGGEPRAISSDGLASGFLAVSPDSRFVAARGPDWKVAIYPVDGGASRPLPGGEAIEQPILWSADGGSLYVFRSREAPARVFKVDIATGRRELWKTIGPADRSGLVAIDNIVMTPDARSYAYSYQQILTSLEVVEGLR